MPDGVVNLIQGRGATAGARLVAHPDVEAISFTGSTEIGHMIYAQGAARGASVQCELGGKNPIIILEDANLDMAAAATAMGAFGSTGQRCTATSRAIVHRSVVDEFIDRMLAAAKVVVPGNGVHSATTMGPSVDDDQYGKVHEYLDIGKAEGVTVACGGGKAVEGDLRAAFDAGFRSVAVVLKNAYRNPEHELAVGEVARRIGFPFVGLSHAVVSEINLTARGDTTTADAYLTPILRTYLDRFHSALSGQVSLRFMQSNGGLAEASSFSGKDAILSGPAGGVVGMVRTAEAAGFEGGVGVYVADEQRPAEGLEEG
ncbi:MAG TPA: aldehyde dehydrogenase family protein, partial [Acidobacteria bacterium]|nr:aldehyde dehydrogenase family protein [Acidobacteriota bacterium]